MARPEEIESLNKVLNRIIEEYDSESICLKEEGREASLRKVVVTDLSADYFALKPDKSKIQIFRSGYGSKQCDYILLSELDGKKVAVFVELKSSIRAGNAVPDHSKDRQYEDYETQLIGSQCLFDYFNSVLTNFCNCPVLGRDYTRYYTVLHENDNPLISEDILLTRPEPNTSPRAAYIRKIADNEAITLRSLIR